jgi:hypothetical protein
VRPPLFGAVAALVLVTACVSSRNARLHPGLRDQSRLQADELASLGPNASMYEVVERLRHRWLEPRSVDPTLPQATDQIVVYSGNSPLGGVDELRYVLARDVRSARFIGGREASALYGPGHASGVILIEMVR